MRLLALVALLVAFDGCAKPDQYREEIQTLRALVEARPAESAIHYYLAQAYASVGDGLAAASEIDELTRLGWNGGLLESDFALVAEDPSFRAAARHLEAARLIRATGVTEAVVTLPELRPEGIALDGDAGRILLGDLNGGGVVAVSGTGETFTFRGGSDGASVYGLKVDSRRKLLWALTNTTPTGDDFQLSGSWLLGIPLARSSGGVGSMRSIALPAGEANDLCLRGGEIFVTDSRRATIYRVDIGLGRVDPIEPSVDLRGANGVACSDEDSLVFIATWLDIYRYSPETGEMRALLKPPTVSTAGMDGLYRFGEQLIGVQNGFGAGRVVSLCMDSTATKVTSVEVLEAGVEGQDIPTTGVIAGHDLLYIVNSQMERPPGEAMRPIIVRRVPLPPPGLCRG